MKDDLVTFDTAAGLIGINKRTLWRRVERGELLKAEDFCGRSMMSLYEVEPHIPLQVTDEERLTIRQADSGDAEAQEALGLWFLSHRRFPIAVYWLELAAKQGFSNSMQLLGRCYLSGHGVEWDKDKGLSWIAKAASYGHVIAKRQMQALSRNG